MSVSTAVKEEVSGPRHIPLEGSPNFRDFGGYRTVDGQQVKWGYLYRSGQLSRLSDSDVEVLAGLALDLVCDFRREEEQQNDPSRLPQDKAPRIFSLPIVPGSNSAFFEDGERDLEGPQAMFNFMVDINRDFVEGQAGTYARMFEAVLATEDARFLVHCAAGKDRTGFAVALVLMALGVSEEVIMQDYLLTAQFYSPRRELARLQSKYGLEHMPAEAVLPMLEVHEDYLQRALQAINSGFGSAEIYLEEVLGVGPAERAELRSRYLLPD